MDPARSVYPKSATQKKKKKVILKALVESHHKLPRADSSHRQTIGKRYDHIRSNLGRHLNRSPRDKVAVRCPLMPLSWLPTAQVAAQAGKQDCRRNAMLPPPHVNRDRAEA